MNPQQRPRSHTRKQKPTRPYTAPQLVQPRPADAPSASVTDEEMKQALAELQWEHERNVQVINHSSSMSLAPHY